MTSVTLTPVAIVCTSARADRSTSEIQPLWPTMARSPSGLTPTQVGVVGRLTAKDNVDSGS
jgi:hypothetical protein